MKRNIFLIAMLAVLLSTSACKRLPVDPTDDPKDTTYVPLTHKLNGTVWKLIDIGSDGGRRNGNVEEMYTLKFSDKMAGGQAACNATYSADFKADEKNITFMKVTPTPSNCGDAGMNEIYYNALKAATTYSYMGGKTLTIYSSNGAILYFEDANTPPPPPTQALAGTSWELFGHQDNRSMMPAPIAVNEKILLTFGPQPDAFGGTSFNKYTVNWKADDKNIAFYNLVSTKIAVPPGAYENEYYRILSGAVTYQILDHGKTLIISDAIESLYFHTEDSNEPPVFKDVVHFADFQVVKFQIDPFQILGLKKIDETHLAITVQYGGGCEEHEFTLYADNMNYARGGADYVEMMLTHNSHQDNCKALITKELIFDVSPLTYKWEKTSVNNRLVLNFSQVPYLSNMIEYKK